jgi:hypothetical protein
LLAFIPGIRGDRFIPYIFSSTLPPYPTFGPPFVFFYICNLALSKASRGICRSGVAFTSIEYLAYMQVEMLAYAFVQIQQERVIPLQGIHQAFAVVVVTFECIVPFKDAAGEFPFELPAIAKYKQILTIPPPLRGIRGAG